MLGETNQSSRYSLAYVRVKEQNENRPGNCDGLFQFFRRNGIICLPLSHKVFLDVLCGNQVRNWTSQPGPSLHLRNRICHFNASRLCTQYQAPEGLHLVCRRQLDVRFRLVQIACRGYIKG